MFCRGWNNSQRGKMRAAWLVISRWLNGYRWGERLISQARGEIRMIMPRNTRFILLHDSQTTVSMPMRKTAQCATIPPFVCTRISRNPFIRRDRVSIETLVRIPPKGVDCSVHFSWIYMLVCCFSVPSIPAARSLLLSVWYV